MGESGAGNGLGQDALLEVRVELVDSDPRIWCQLEIGSTMTLDKVHRVLQTAFGWEDMHLHRFTALEPFVPLRPVDGLIPDDLQCLPRQEWFEPDFKLSSHWAQERLRTSSPKKGEGLYHVCFAVDNAEDFLRSRGQVGGIFTGGSGLPCAFLKAAPEGIAVEIVQREHPPS